MICARWRSDLSAGVYAVLGRNPWRTEWRRRYRQILRADPCAYCGGPGGQVDHIVPKARSNRGQEQSWHNLTATCDECNNRKADAPLLLWLANQEAPRSAWAARRPRKSTRKQLRRHLLGLLIGRAWRLAGRGRGDQAREGSLKRMTAGPESKRTAMRTEHARATLETGSD